MRLNFKTALLTLAFIPLAACAAGPTIPTAGTVIDAKFMQDYAPAFKKGTKWTYAQTSVNGTNTVKSEITQEVTDVQGDVATLKVSTKVDGVAEVTTTTDTVSTKPKATVSIEGVEASLKSEGSADVTVPYKEFKGIAKVSMVNGAMSFYAWYAPGVGLVKSEMTSGAGDITAKNTMELKDFVSP